MEEDTQVVLFWVILITSIIIGIITRFWLGTFLVGFSFLPLVFLIIIFLKWWWPRHKKKHDWENKHRLRVMYCKTCHKAITPVYTGNDIWVYDCHDCGRTWKTKW